MQGRKYKSLASSLQGFNKKKLRESLQNEEDKKLTYTKLSINRHSMEKVIKSFDDQPYVICNGRVC